MANKTKKKPAAAPSDDSSVVRIKAGTSASKKQKDTKKVVAAEVVATKPAKTKTTRKVSGGGLKRPFVAIWAYFKGAWFELRQVRWPNRRATWSLTGAVLAYTAFFIVLILLLDAAFKYLFELILGK